MQADQELIVFLSYSARTRVTQADDAHNCILIGGRLALQKLTRGLAQQFCSRSMSAAGELVERCAQA